MLRLCTKKKILIVGPIEEINADFEYACTSLEDVERLMLTGEQIRIHFKINTGMNRYGFTNIKEFCRALKLIKKSKLIVEGIFTHFATTDDMVDVQMRRFIKFVQVCKRCKFNPIIHVDNSSVNLYKNHDLDMVRIGFNLYNRDDGVFSSVVRIKSKVVNVNTVKRGELVGYDRRCVVSKKKRGAVIPIGYADGFDIRYIGMNLKVDGVNCEVLNVCMDCFMLDVTNTNIKKGDDINILDNINSLYLYAVHAGISEYQVMTNFSNMRADYLVAISQSKYEQQ